MRDFSKFIEAEWLIKLNPFLQGEEFSKISDVLVKEQAVITPSLLNVFRAFKECPYKDLKLVICGFDPYPGLTPDKQRVADGIAFSSRNSINKPPKSLEFIYRAWEEDFTITMDRRNNDLTYLANQGVLFLNTALTTRIGKTGEHGKLWEPFIKYVLKMLNQYNNGIVYLFMGKVAQEFIPLLTKERNFVLKCSHPASAAYSGGVWKHEHIFDEVQKILDMAYNTKLKFNTT